MLEMIAMVVYAVASCTAIMALLHSNFGAERFKFRMLWGSVAALFVVLIVIRASGAEEHVRAGLREFIAQRGMYANREVVQIPLAAATLLGSLLIAAIALYRRPPARLGKRARYAYYAALASWCYVPLLLMRVISLHAFDTILYTGPIRVNWVADLGLASLATIMGARFVHRTRDIGKTIPSKLSGKK